MKAIIWCIFILAVLLWTGASVLVVNVIEWSAKQLSTGSPALLETAASNIAIPIWMSPWLDPSTWAMIFMSIQGFLSSAASAVPFLGSMLGWLAPLVWVLWGLGVLALLALAIVGTLLLKRYRTRRHYAHHMS
jgi:hypothetical protein